MKILFPIISIVAIICTFIFVINPYYQDVSSLNTEIAVYNTGLDNSTNLLKTEDALIKSYNEITDSNKERLDNFLPNSVNNIQFILELERMGNVHNMPVKDIRFEPIKTNITGNTIVSSVSSDNKPYGVFPFEFTTEGKYDQFILFLKDLETNLRLVDVKSISFTVPDYNGKIVSGTDPSVYKYSVKVETYWLK